ncbi:CRISPR-associated endonuclease Cas2 [Pontibacillus yanchengensis]|uniref:CRISPR-associated endoribonuclease Cas2 n=1 Tax=Pontibacillus yanchengensis Y32 TaxID=1385514 RepID=A0A0A2THM9_9BACI|nr:CRISPR-associated endonuclease Cas2 [Pontibacillus yanchengensis]KGP73586.1 CRISPR-associated protein Cas2 [Pontibacillus yanchengensis Y32]
MLIVITYDVSTKDSASRKRLRKVSKLCQDYGIRVQNSVFECFVDSTQLKQLEFKLINLINDETDILRIYRIGDKHKNKVKHIGAKETFDLEDSLFI